MLRNLLLRLSKLLLWLIGLSALLVLLFRWVPPPFTALMIERKIESWRTGETIDLTRDWRPWKVLPDDLKMAVIAAEDQKFADHWGFDVAAIRAALSHNERGGSLRGASTLSQQVAKNLFLWSGRSWPRKGLEAWFTALIELLWPKQRILEVYLNSVEWGDGVFGGPASLRHRCTVPVDSPGQPPRRSAAQPARVERWQTERPCEQSRRLDSATDAPAGWQALPAADQTGPPGLVAGLALNQHAEQPAQQDAAPPVRDDVPPAQPVRWALTMQYLDRTREQP